jgi:hypothetical protein
MHAAEILASRPEGEALLLEEAVLSDAGTLHARFRTNAWWADSQPAKLTLSVESVVEMQFSLLPGQLVQSAKIDPHSPLLWDYGPAASIFGNAPLPDPPRFFHEFHELVCGTLGIMRDPIKYLNWQGSFLGWRNIVVSRSFQLLSAGAPLVEAAAPLLDAQAAEYAILPDPPGGKASLSQPPSCALMLGDSWVLGASVLLA